MAISRDIIGADVQIGTNEAQASLAKLAKTTGDLTKENEALRIERAKLVAQGKKNSEDYKRLTQQINENNKTIRGNKEQMQALGKTIGVTAMSANQLSKRAKELKSQLNGMVKSANPKEWDRLNKELEETNAQMATLRAGTKKTGGVFSKLKGAAGGLLPAFGWGAIIAGAVQAGKAIFNLAKETQQYRAQIAGLTGLEGKQLADLTANITASAQTFKKEVNEMAIANNALAQTFGISNEQAQILIDQGFVAGADATGEFLDQIKEYPAQFKAAGLSAEESIAIITQQTKTGVFSDKGVDAIKEATIRLREMTPATKAALNQIGISSDELEKKLKEGTITYAQAIGQVSEKLGELPEQSTEVGTAIADVFGGAGEDAGLQYIKTLKDIGKGLNDVQGATSENQKAQAKLLQANQKLQKAWSDMLGTGTSTFTSITASAKMLLADGIVALMSSLRSLQEWFVNAYNESEPFRFAMESFFALVKTGIDITKTQLKVLWDSLVGGTKLILSLFTFDKDKIAAAWTDLVGTLKADVTDFGKSAYNNFKEGFDRAASGQKLQLPAPEVKTAEGTTVPISQTSEAASGTTAEKITSQAEKYKKETEDLKQAQLERLNELKLQRTQEILSQEEFDALMMEQKALMLEEEKLLLEQFGMDTAEIEAEILDNKIANLDKESQERNKLQKQKEKEAKGEKKLEQERKKIRDASLNNFISIVGEESALGKASLVAKQGIAVGEAAMAIGVGTANTAKIGFPQNIPALLAFAAQTAGLVGSIKSAAGFKSGGFTDTATSDDEISDFVHANEFVGNAKAVRNPTVRPIFDIIDSAQRNGTIESINLPNAIAAQNVIRGEASDQGQQTGEQKTESSMRMMDTLNGLASAVNTLVQEGVIANFDFDNYQRGLEKMDNLTDDVSA